MKRCLKLLFVTCFRFGLAAETQALERIIAHGNTAPERNNTHALTRSLSVLTRQRSRRPLSTILKSRSIEGSLSTTTPNRNTGADASARCTRNTIKTRCNGAICRRTRSGARSPSIVRLSPGRREGFRSVPLLRLRESETHTFLERDRP